MQLIEPIRLLQQSARLPRPFPTAVYAVWRPAPNLLKAHLELSFTTTTQPAG